MTQQRKKKQSGSGAKRSSKPASSRRKGQRRWSGKVKTVSTFPREGLFTEDAETIAREMGSRRVSPKGVGSGIRMIQFFINRAGKNLPASRRRELERAKRILQRRREKEKDKEKERSR